MTEEINETSIPPSQPEIVPEMPKKNPLKVVFLVVLGLFVVAGAVYMGIKIGRKQIFQTVLSQPTVAPQPTAIPTPDETANWKTYQNSTYGYSLKYPNTWILNDSAKPSTVSFLSGKTEGAIFYFSVVFEGRNDNKLSLEQWWLNSIDQFANKIELQNNTDRSLVRVDNLEGYKITNGKNWTSIPFTEVYIQSSNGNIFKLSSGFTETKEQKKTFNQILSTFKFTQ